MTTRRVSAPLQRWPPTFRWRPPASREPLCETTARPLNGVTRVVPQPAVCRGPGSQWSTHGLTRSESRDDRPSKKQGRAAGRESRAALPLVSPLHQGVRGGLSHRWGLCPGTQPTPPNRAGARPATTLSPRRCPPQSAAHPPAVIPAQAGIHGATPTTLSATRHPLPRPSAWWRGYLPPALSLVVACANLKFGHPSE